MGAAALVGCEYPEPLSTEAEALIDARLLGKWRCLVTEFPKVLDVSVTALGRGRYFVEVPGVFEGDKKAADAYGGEDMLMPMHLTSYGPVRIANLDASPRDPARRWFLVRPVLVRDDLVDVQLVELPLDERTGSPAEWLELVREGLQSNPEDPRLYHTFGACIRNEQ